MCKECDNKKNFNICPQEHRDKWSNRDDCWLFRQPLLELTNSDEVAE